MAITMQQLRLDEPASEWPDLGGKRRRRGDKITPEDRFAAVLKARGLPPFERGFMFAKQAFGRRWQFDFCWRQFFVAVEIEGLVVRRLAGQLVVIGRHASITGFREDAWKYGHAAALGWHVLRFEQQQSRTDEAFELLELVLKRKGWKRP